MRMLEWLRKNRENPAVSMGMHSGNSHVWFAMQPGDRLASVRKELGVSQNKFAHTIGLSLKGLAGVERGDIPLRRMMALAIEAAHGVRHEWLLNGGGERFTTPRRRETDRAHVVAPPHITKTQSRK